VPDPVVDVGRAFPALDGLPGDPESEATSAILSSPEGRRSRRHALTSGGNVFSMASILSAKSQPLPKLSQVRERMCRSLTRRGSSATLSRSRRSVTDALVDAHGQLGSVTCLRRRRQLKSPTVPENEH